MTRATNVKCPNTNLLVQSSSVVESSGEDLLFIFESDAVFRNIVLRDLHPTTRMIPMKLGIESSLEARDMSVGWFAAGTPTSQTPILISKSADIRINKWQTLVGGVQTTQDVDLDATDGLGGGRWFIPTNMSLPAGLSPNSFNSGTVFVMGGV